MREFVPLDLDGLPETYDITTLEGQPIVEVVESDRKIELSYRFTGFFRSPRERDVQGTSTRFDVLHIGAAGYLMASGRPQLPSFGRYVQIPPGAGFKVHAETTTPPVVLSDVLVHPAQVRMTDEPTRPVFEFDRAFYELDEDYPRDLVAVTGPFEVDGYTALLIHVRPLQYNPRRKQLRAFPRIVVHVALEAPVGEPLPRPRWVEPYNAFGNLMLNPKRGIWERVGFVEPPRPLVRPIGPQLLIVHAPQFAQAAATLAAWKRRRGLLTDLLEFDLGDYPDPQTGMAALKGEIRMNRGAPGSRLRYVLLFGDGDDIPFETRGTNATDYYYSTETDYAPAAPFAFPWLSLGRIPVRDATEAAAVVSQIVGYEKSPPTDPAYYERFICAAHFETNTAPDGAHDDRDYAFTMETIRAFLVSQGRDAERVYTCDTSVRPLLYMDGQLVPADVEAAIVPAGTAELRLVDATTEGCAVIAHRDHGDESGWYMPPFTMTSLDQVTGDVPSIFYSVNCLTGSFHGTTSGECFAEKNLRLPGTAPTIIAATEPSGTWLNNAMMLALFDGTYGGLLPTFPGTTTSYPVRANRIGDLLNYARTYLPVALPGTDVRSHCEMYHVLGDPSLEVWAHEPNPLHISTRAGRGMLHVTLNPLPPDCVLTIWLGGTFVTRFTPASAHVSLPLPPGPLKPPPFGRPRLLAICAWAPGFRFAETHVALPPVSTRLPAPSLAGVV